MGGNGFSNEEKRFERKNQAELANPTSQTGAKPPVTAGIPNSVVNASVKPSGEESDPQLLDKIKNRGTEANTSGWQGAKPSGAGAPLTQAQKDRARYLRRYSMSNKEYTAEEDDLKDRLALANERIEGSGVDKLNAQVYEQEGLLGANVASKPKSVANEAPKPGPGADETPKPEPGADEAAANEIGGKKARLPDLITRLKESSKSAIVKFFKGGDSELYKQLTSHAGAVNDALKTKVDSENFATEKEKAIGLYKSLLDSCRAYLDKNKDPSTSQGKARKALVEQLNDVATNDVIAIHNGENALEASGGSMTLLDMVASEARTVKINLDDGRKVIDRGAASSTRKEFTEGGKDVFFTSEEILKNRNDAIKSGVEQIGDAKIKKVFGSFMKTSEGINAISSKAWLSLSEASTYDEAQEAGASMKTVMAALEQAGMDLGGPNSDKENPAIVAVAAKARAEVIAICSALHRTRQGADNAQTVGGLKVGSIVSNRNVAMTRVADLLGIGDMLARSVNAEVTEGGKTKKGNLMDKAKGRDAAGLEKHNIIQKTDLSSGELQRQLTCLQMLDMLCNQADRHLNNVFFDIDESGNFKGLQGIDNDYAFGDKDDMTTINNRRTAMVNTKGFAELPVVDKELAERLIALKPEMLKLVLADIIKDDSEAAALISRLETIRGALIKMKERDESAFLERDQWGEETAQMLALQGGNSERSKDNYFSNFIMTANSHKERVEKDNATSSYAGVIATPSVMRTVLNRRGADEESITLIESDLFPLLDKYHASVKDNNKGETLDAAKQIYTATETITSKLKQKPRDAWDKTAIHAMDTLQHMINDIKEKSQNAANAQAAKSA